MNLRILTAFLAVALGLATTAQAQFKHETDGAKGCKLGEDTVQRWKAGMIITAEGGPCLGLSGSAPIPFDWPEQQVTIVGEDLSPQAKLSYETVNGTARRMQVKIDQIPAGQEVKAIITVEVRRWILLPPDKTDIYELPDKHKIEKNLRIYLAPSKLIESTNPKIKALARKIGVDKEKAWDHVEEIYDWVRAHVKYQAGPLKGALAALRDGTGDCEEVTSLFVAICRAADIPARSVWVPGHCYPEFYLVDDDGKGHWFPCQSAGSRAFGGIPNRDPILQKGDNFKVGRESKRYLAEELTGGASAGKPKVKFVRELVQ